jgi:hypothetical protein
MTPLFEEAKELLPHLILSVCSICWWITYKIIINTRSVPTGIHIRINTPVIATTSGTKLTEKVLLDKKWKPKFFCRDRQIVFTPALGL